VGVRIKVLRADRQAAIERLDEAARVAQTPWLTRLRAMVEKIRLRLSPFPEFDALPVRSYEARSQPVDAIERDHRAI
jgi:hypothetical protein